MINILYTCVKTLIQSTFQRKKLTEIKSNKGWET
jgi:hypothetical protein